MQIEGKYYQTIWVEDSTPEIIRVIDQQKLPFIFEIRDLFSVDDVYDAIKNMTIRGAPLIGAAGAFGIYLAALEAGPGTNMNNHLQNAARYLTSSRPTAVNLKWAIDKVLKSIAGLHDKKEIVTAAFSTANGIVEKEKENCLKIGENGLEIIESISKNKNGATVNILTHCNAGWLACIDYGTATAPIYLAHDKKIPVHVWVDETRPRNQGARLTAFELGNHGVPYTLISDNTGGYLMQKGMVDIVIVGCDRATRRGDIANKIGTYLKALAANDNNIPFFSAFPSSSIDFSIFDGLKEIPVEIRDPEEVTMIEGIFENKILNVRLCPENASAVNYGFDVTPANLVTGLITERGICKATEESIKELFSDKF
jgi:methylthioribose-1-phosphate isomerase